MREVTRTVYESFDGRAFDTAAECRAHERENVHLALVGLTIEQVDAALSRDNKHLGDAIEAVALRIRQKRIEDGDLKRARRKEGDSATPIQVTDDGHVVGGEPDMLRDTEAA
jgi:hypothetical protein